MTAPTRKRIWLRNGRKRKKFALCGGPIPRLNDVCTMEGTDWIVFKIEDTEILAEFSTANGKLKQVFP